MQQFPLQKDLSLSRSLPLHNIHLPPTPNCVAKKLDQQQPRSQRRAAPSRNYHHRRRIAQAYSTSTCLSGFLLPPPHAHSLSLSSLSLSVFSIQHFIFIFLRIFARRRQKKILCEVYKGFFLFRKNLQESPCFEGQQFAIFDTMSSPEKKRDPEKILVRSLTSSQNWLIFLLWMIASPPTWQNWKKEALIIQWVFWDNVYFSVEKNGENFGNFWFSSVNLN